MVSLHNGGVAARVVYLFDIIQKNNDSGHVRFALQP